MCVCDCDTMQSGTPDNQRFLTMFNAGEIIKIKSAKYASVDDVFESEPLHMAGERAYLHYGNEKDSRFHFQLPDDVHVFVHFERKTGLRISRKTIPTYQKDWSRS